MTTLNRLVLESGLSREVAADLEPLTAALHGFLPARSPRPSPALAALLRNPPRATSPGRARRRVVALGTAAAAVSSLAITGVAAATNELPAPAQQLVADLSERYLPFEFPAPSPSAAEPDGDGSRTPPAAVLATHGASSSTAPPGGHVPRTGASIGPNSAATRNLAPAGPPPAVLPQPAGATSTATVPPAAPAVPAPAPTPAAPSPTPVTSAPPSPDPSPGTSGSAGPPAPPAPSPDAAPDSGLGGGVQDPSPPAPSPSG